MTTTTDSLARAIAYLNAVKVSETRHAAKLGDRWFTFTDARLTDPVGDQWQTSGDYTPMPSWWTPEKRTTTRCKHGDGGGTCNDGVWEVTADLETGAEVPA